MKALALTSYPEREATESNFAIIEVPKPEVPQGDFLAKLSYISVDPYLRNKMKPGGFELNQPADGFTAGEVVESTNADYPVGTLVAGMSPFSEFVLGSTIRFLNKVPVGKDLLNHACGILGMPGVTAYFGFFDVLKPKAGETLVVSGASGAVGSYVIQLAKAEGCRVIGIVGSAAKQKFITEELKADAAINYKTDNIEEKLKEYAPNGVDLYFDNVGGSITDAVFNVLNLKGRVGVCGSISAYNDLKADVGPRQWLNVIGKSLTIQGFLVFTDFAPKWGEGVEGMAKYLLAGKIIAKESYENGWEKIPQAFINLFTGASVGKQLVRLEA